MVVKVVLTLINTLFLIDIIVSNYNTKRKKKLYINNTSSVSFKLDLSLIINVLHFDYLNNLNIDEKKNSLSEY